MFVSRIVLALRVQFASVPRATSEGLATELGHGSSFTDILGFAGNDREIAALNWSTPGKGINGA